MAVKQTYDTLFSRIFSVPERASDLVRNLVPQPVLSRIELESINIDERSFVDKRLRRHFSDLLLRFELREADGAFDRDRFPGGERTPDMREIYVYILFDHKSSIDKWVSFQLLRYIGNIYQRILDPKNRKGEEEGRPDLLPEVVPVVFYHGQDPWRSSLQTADLIKYTEERGYIPHFEPILCDLREIDEERLIGTIQTAAALVFFKYIKRDFTEEESAPGRILEYLHRLPPGSEERYLFERVVAEVKNEEETGRFLAQSREKGYTDIEEEVMTFAEAKLNEGRKKGKQEGIEEGRQEGTLKDKRDVLKRLLNRKFDLSDEEAERIDGIEDLEALDAALDEIIDAEEKRQVMEKLGL